MDRLFPLWFLLNFVFILCKTTFAYPQVIEHNYNIGPQFTSCDSLIIKDLGSHEAIEKIRAAEFRFKQNFKLTRKEGFKGAEFYSCDGEDGYLIINYTESTQLYFDVKKAYWEKLKKSADPEGYYLEIKEELLGID